MAVDLRPGDRFLDRFRIEYLAAEGGMASIYSARDELTSHSIAVKVLYPYYSDNAIIRTRFLEEGRIQQLLKHPNIVRVFQILDEPLMAILMEFVDGPTLDEYLGDEGPLSQEQVIDVIIPVMSALGFAHSRGIIHRDIKPSNILLQDSDVRRPKVVDFGVAKVKGGRQDLTATGTTVGTLHYMSPEQIVGSKSIDGRADIYSVGVTMYKLVTGEVPFNAPTEFALMMAQVEAPPLPPSRLRSGLSKELEAIILKAMEKKPDDRFQSIREFTQALLSLRIDSQGTIRDTVSERISVQLLDFAMQADEVAQDLTGEMDLELATMPLKSEPPLDTPTQEIEETLKIDRRQLLKAAESAGYAVAADKHSEPTVQIGASELAQLTGREPEIDESAPTENIPSLQSRLKAADSKAETRPVKPMRLRTGELPRVQAPDQDAKTDEVDSTRPSTPSAKRERLASSIPQLNPLTGNAHVDSADMTRPELKPRTDEDLPTPVLDRPSVQAKPLEPPRPSGSAEALELDVHPRVKRPSGPKMVLGKNYADTQERTREKPRLVPPVAPSQMGFPPLPTPRQNPQSRPVQPLPQPAPDQPNSGLQQVRPPDNQPQPRRPQDLTESNNLNKKRLAIGIVLLLMLLVLVVFIVLSIVP